MTHANHREVETSGGSGLNYEAPGGSCEKRTVKVELPKDLDDWLIQHKIISGKSKSRVITLALQELRKSGIKII